MSTPQEKSLSFKKPLISLFFFILIVILDIFLSEEISESNKTLTIYLQKSGNFNTISLLLTVLGETLLEVSLLCIIFFIMADKLYLLIFLCFLCLNGYSNGLIKLMYADTRPFMEFEEIEAWSCEMSLGKPSGHAQSSIMFYLFLTDYISFKICEKINGKRNKLLFKALMKSLAFILIFFIGFSRVVRGVHSFWQVFMGWACGLLILSMFFVFGNTLCVLIKNYVENNSYNNENEIKRKKYLKIHLLSFIIFLVITLMIFELRRQYTEFRSLIFENIEKKCEKNLNGDYFFDQTVTSTSYFCFIFGVILGFILTKGDLKNELYWDSAKSLNCWKWFVRLILLCLICLIAALPYLLQPVKGTNIYIIILFKNYLPFFSEGVAVVYLMPLLYKCFRVEIDGDLMKCISQNSERKTTRCINKLEFI